MWSKLSSALKRPGTPGLGPDDDENSPVQANVMSSLYEQHPNMSVFHQPEEQQDVPFPSPSPPASPSRHGRRRLLKRMSRNPFNDSDMAVTPAPNKLHIGFPIPKKVKSSLQSISTSSELSLSRPSTDSARTQEDHTARASLESARPPQTPVTPHEGRFGSLRSILKPNHTPGTGASVRFFSRDAYKVISPDNSNNSAGERDDSTIFNRLHKTAQPRPTALEVFSPTSFETQEQASSPVSPTGVTSLMMPIPPPNMTNIFDLSEDKDLPSIPVGLQTPLLDSAVEISDDAEDLNSSIGDYRAAALALVPPERTATPVRDLPKSSPLGMHDRSQSFSFGQTVFYSMAAAESTPAPEPLSKSSSSSSYAKSTFSKNRGRAMSDTVFHSMIHSPQSALVDSKRPEADINDTSSAVVVLGSPEKEKDPFGAHAKTYYVPGTVLPPSPPQSTHARKASREEDLIWSLRTQLALKDELCAQFESELNTKDDMVREWQNRATEAEKESERRKLAARSYRKKFAEFQKYIQSLEDEVERSRESSMERSVMDEASSEALRMLHRRIGELEHDSGEREKKERSMKEELEMNIKELENIKEELTKKNVSEQELREGINAAKNEMEQMGAQRQSMIQSEDHLAARERHQTAAATWELEKAKITSNNDFLRKEQIALQAQLTDAREEIVRREEETGVLRTELEAQWKHTEKTGDDFEKLRQERDAMKTEVEALESRISGMEMEWNENENKKVALENDIQELWATKDDMEKERDELESQLRAEQDHAMQLTQALQEREDRVTVLTQERQYAQDTAARLSENLRQRDAEIAGYTKRFREREEEVDQIREDMLKSKREHSRIVDEQSRTLSEVVAREVESRAHMESVVRDKAETDVFMDTLKERVDVLKEEVERLRRQVHELQQESADKEVKLAQASKQRAQDKEDLQGLNIALDSKQQELELLKRRVSLPTRGSATSTPATGSKTSAPSTRRESSIFGTPLPSSSRPPSVLSDTGSATAREPRKLSDPPSSAKPALGRSIRANAASSTTNGSAAAGKRVEGSMGPPPMKRASSLAQSTSSTGSATPTRVPSFGSGTVPGRPSSVTPTAVGRRGSVSNEPSKLKTSIASRESLRTNVGSISEQEEKENVSVSGTGTGNRIGNGRSGAVQSSGSATPSSSSMARKTSASASPTTSKPARRMSALVG